MPGSHRYLLITFDVYTALFDVEGSLTPLVRQALGASADRSALSAPGETSNWSTP